MATTNAATFSDPIIDIDEDQEENSAPRRNAPKSPRVTKGTIKTPEDRHSDIAKLHRMMLLAAAIVTVMVAILVASDISPFFLDYFAIPLSVTLMVVWSLFFIVTTNGVLAKRYLLRLYMIMGLYVALSAISRFVSWYLFAVLALIILVIEVFVLVWTLQATPPPETDLQKSFFGTLTKICTIAALLSIFFILYTVASWPSKSSLDSAVASFFCYAYASFVASKVAGSRGNCNEPTIICSSDAVSGYLDIPRLYKGSWPVVGNICVGLVFVFLWPPDKAEPYSWTIGGALLPAFFGIQAYFHQSNLLKARRFHVRSDASILVETLSKTYAYDKAVSAVLQPAGSDLPKQTETCHVYCARMYAPTVLIDLAGGQQLCLAPEFPNEFLDAINIAVDGSKAF